MSRIKQILKIKSSLCLFLYLLGIILCLGIALLNTQGLIDIKPLFGRLALLPYLAIDREENGRSNWIYNVFPILIIDQLMYQQWIGVFLFLALWIAFLMIKKSEQKKETLFVSIWII